MPVLGPKMARNAGGTVDSMQKNRITRDESLRLRLYDNGPSMPKVMLREVSKYSPDRWMLFCISNRCIFTKRYAHQDSPKDVCINREPDGEDVKEPC